MAHHQVSFVEDVAWDHDAMQAGEVDRDRDEEGERTASVDEAKEQADALPAVTDDATDTVATEKVSYLPAWVLQMRAKIEASRLVHSDASARLVHLNKSVSILGDRINEMLPINQGLLKPLPVPSPSLPLPKSATPSTSSPRSSSLKVSPDKRLACLSLPRKVLGTPKLPLHQLPEDIFYLIFEYLPFSDIFQVRACSRSLRLHVQDNGFWVCAGVRRLPFLFRSRKFAPPAAFKDADHPMMCGMSQRIALHRSHLETYLRQFRQSTRFLSMMKEQRSIPKFKQVDPRRYHRYDRHITHPLPLFGSTSTSSSSNTAWEGGSTTTNSNHNMMTTATMTTTMMMSHAETLNSDFRTFAHHALDTMVILSAALHRPVSCAWVDAGVVSVMVSLLANEEAAIQNYACTILANLLCWGASSRRSEHFVTRSVDDLVSGVVRAEHAAARHGEQSHATLLTDQVAACNGRRQLPTLLTSPSAAVNLVMRSPNLPHGSQKNHTSPSHALPPISSIASAATTSMADVAGGGTGGRTVTTTSGTSRIQGVCNMSASRALINLFYPDFPVHTDRQRVESYLTSTNSLSPSSSSSSSSSSSFEKSGLHTTKPGESHGIKHTGESNIDTEERTRQQQQQQQQQLPLFHPLHRYLAQENSSRPWQFTYFYKSGAFKDQFTSMMRFVSNGLVVGSGYDNIGAFLITGEVQREILGQTLFLQKMYLSATSYGNVLWSSAKDAGSNDDRHVSSAEVTTEVFLQSLVRKLTLSKGYKMPAAMNGIEHGALAEPIIPSTSMFSAHVVHIAYWSDGIPVSSLRDPPSERINTQSSFLATTARHPNAENTATWSEGLWGVWETHTNQSHYELQKGGVFRALPVEFL